MTLTKLPPCDEKVRFRYLAWQDIYRQVKPYRTDKANDGRHDDQPHNLVFRCGEEQTVYDIRGIEDRFSLDENGFTYLKHSSAMTTTDFFEREKVERTFIPECEALIRKVVTDHDIFIFDWRLRRNTVGFKQVNDMPGHALAKILPASENVHIDQSWSSVVRRVRLHFPERAESILSGRVQMLNIWRPINGPVQDRPLAVCDGKTVDMSRTIEARILRDGYVGHSMYAFYDPRMTWFYLSRQDNDEPLLFKSFDTLNEAVKCVPHSSFTHQKIPSDAVPRESIEVRALAFPNLV